MKKRFHWRLLALLLGALPCPFSFSPPVLHMRSCSLLASKVKQVPVQFIQALPYVLTVILLAGFIGRAIPPRAIGVPFVKER